MTVEDVGEPEDQQALYEAHQHVRRQVVGPESQKPLQPNNDRVRQWPILAEVAAAATKQALRHRPHDATLVVATQRHLPTREQDRQHGPGGSLEPTADPQRV